MKIEEEKKKMAKLCPTFIPSIKWIQADNTIAIILELESAWTHAIPYAKLEHKTQQNRNKLN